ncbi:MAG TPA: alpha/beta hydrolase [Ktedonobacter sp.]|nr:alpha/beta hydrolase [Ktedonobacter sp.]
MTETTQQQTKALVLGGGGTTGIAWEIGILLGLHDGGLDVSNAELVVGTSAGSVVGAQITSGVPLETLYARQLQPIEETKEQVVSFDMNELMHVFAAGIGAPDAQTGRARIGAAALAAKTMPEQERIDIITSRLPVQQWPQIPHLVITAVDAHTGEAVRFDRDTGVPLALAVAASCAVPGVYPPVTIGTHRYVDGGVRSGTNADIAQGYQLVLILRAEAMDVPAQNAQYALPFMRFEDEQAVLERSGSQMLVITPDEASTVARGPNPLDASRRATSAQAGRTQGRLLAEHVRHFWEAQ